MADHDDSKFRIKPGRSRTKGTRIRSRDLSFFSQVKIAVQKAGGTPNRIDFGAPGSGRKGGGGSGRFNARGRGAKVMATIPRDVGAWQRDSLGRFRSRRVVVKARVVRLAASRGSRGLKIRGGASASAVDAHLRYLERDGVTRDGDKGRTYSAFEDQADSKAFLERGRNDRHQFRFIVAPEDAAEMGDLKRFTRDLMRKMEADLDTNLDWIAVDHHNTGHPHTHVIVRGVLDDGRILNIAGDYIAHGVRHRAQDLVTLDLGPQTEIELRRKLTDEVEAERWTRLDKMIAAEQRDQGVIDLRPGEAASYLVRENRANLIGRVRTLERYGLASEIEPGQWQIKDRAETVLKELSERNDIIKTMHRALADHGLADERGPAQYVRHDNEITAPIVGLVLAKGLAGDEMSDRLHLVIDGVDGHTHYVETTDTMRLDEVKRGHIIKLDPLPVKTEPRAADLNIRDMASAHGGVFRPSEHLEATRARIERINGDPDAFVRSHVRRLEALRRAGHVERIHADAWKIPADIAERGIAYDARDRGKDFSVRTLSALSLDKQIDSDGATWLDRELTSPTCTPLAQSGFGRDVSEAMERRRQNLVDQGHATRLEDGRIRAPKDLIARLEATEVSRVGKAIATERGLTYTPGKPGEHVTGRLAGVAELASGRYAMIDDGLGFQLVPWQPVLDKQIGKHVSGLMREAGGGIEWSLGRRRGLGM